MFKSIIALTLAASAAAFAPASFSGSRASMALSSSVEDRVLKVVDEQLQPSVPVSADSSFIDDLGADSLDTVEMIMALEEEFDIEFPEEMDDDENAFSTVGKVVSFVEGAL